jgi:hypothetical protein
MTRVHVEEKGHELRARVLRKHEALPKKCALPESAGENAQAAGSFGDESALDSLGGENLAGTGELDPMRHAEVKGRGLVLGPATRLRPLEAEAREVAFREPARVGERGFEIGERVLFLRRKRGCIRMAKDAPQYGVHEASAGRRTEGGGETNGLVDRGPLGNAIEVTNLEKPHAQRPEEGGIEIRERPRGMPREDPVEAASKAEHPLDDGHREIPVRGGERLVLRTGEKSGRLAASFLDCLKNFEGNPPRG